MATFKTEQRLPTVTNPKIGTPEQVAGINTTIENINKMLAEGIQLPDAPLPNVAGGTKAEEKPLGISTSSPARSYEDVQREVELEKRAGRERLQKSYDMKLGNVSQERAGMSRALGGALGTQRRASTSAQQYIKFVDEDYKKRIASLELQRDEAMENADSQMLQAINSRLNAERQNWIAEQDMAMKQYEYDRQLSEYEQEQNLPFDTASTESAVASLFNKGITDPSIIQQTFLAQGIPISLEAINAVKEQISQPEGMAGVVFNNPSLFSKLTSTQIGEIAPKLAEMGFDFQSAMEETAKKVIAREITSTTKFTDSDFSKIDADIKEFGLEMTIEGLPEDQANQIRDRYKSFNPNV